MEICETGHHDKLSEAENRDTKQKVFFLLNGNIFQAVKLTKYLKTNLLNGPKTFISSV